MPLTKLDGRHFKEMVISGASLLEKNKEGIDALNVFPVPDGDTGTNMSLTMVSCAREVDRSGSALFCEVARAAATGALKGARGNSGVILSQLMRGFAKETDSKESLTPDEFVDCLRAGVELAYKAVRKPREGTILTVARVIAEDMTAIKPIGTFEELFEKLLTSGERILRKTPDMLPILKQAGVVDAGGKGLLTIYSGYSLAIGGRALMLDDGVFGKSANLSGAAAEVDEGSIEFGYCTEFFIKNVGEGFEEKSESLRDKLSRIGDCVLVVGDAQLLKVHCHSNHPGQVIEYALEIGMLSGLKVDNMREQHNTIIEEAKAVPGASDEPKPRAPFGIIAVSPGDGISEVFRELGAGWIISGGQTMNPSTESFLEAIAAAHADTVYILPNNSNIILAATQAAELTEDCRVVVVPTRTIPEGMSALMGFVPEATADQNEAAMAEAFAATRSGRVTYAVRDTAIEGSQIHSGDIMGLTDGRIVAVGSEINLVALETVAELAAGEEPMVVTVFYGAEVSAEKAEELECAVRELYPSCDIQMVNGAQPVYYYIFSVE